MRHVRSAALLSLAVVACKEPPPPPPPPVVEVKVEAPPPPPIEPATSAAMEAWMKLEAKKNLPIGPVVKVLDQLEASPVPSDPKYAGQFALAKWKAVAKLLTIEGELREAAAKKLAEDAAKAEAAEEPLGDAVAAPALQDPEFDAFAKKYASRIVFNAGAGAHFINAAEAWKDATTYAETPSADDLAWIAADTLLAGECDGAAPCYLDRCNQTAGEYLRRHPKGAHAETALAMVRSSMPEAEDESILSLNRADLFKANEALEALLTTVGKVTHNDAAETLTALRTTIARFAEVKPK